MIPERSCDGRLE